MIAVRTEDVLSLLESERARCFTAFLMAREAVFHGIRWFGNFPHTVEDKQFDMQVRKILRLLTPLVVGMVAHGGHDDNDLFQLATQPSYHHAGGYDFDCLAAFCDFTSETPDVLNGAMADSCSPCSISSRRAERKPGDFSRGVARLRRRRAFSPRGPAAYRRYSLFAGRAAG